MIMRVIPICRGIACRRPRKVGQVSDLPCEYLEDYEGGSKTRPTSILRLLTLSALFALSARAEVLIERTFLPDAHASSFAFSLPGGVNFCYDPIRGGVNYAWTGGFLDLANVRPLNKLIQAATLLGPVVYRETGLAPLRRGDALRVPAIEFKGYTLRDSAVELRYTVDGMAISETISALPAHAGLRRRFKVEAAGADSKWWHVAEGRPPASLALDGLGAFVLEHVFKSSAP